MELYSPYRICPLGAHIDHQLGIVLGTTINRGIHFKFTPNKTGKVCLHSLDYNERIEFSMPVIESRIMARQSRSVTDIPRKTGHWSDYARGAVWVLNEFCHYRLIPSPQREEGRARRLKYGIDAEINADFPGGGLSSSAAIAIAYLLALEKVNNLDISAEENIKLVQKLENEYIGLKNGILDQSIILLTKPVPNSMVYLDCKTLEHRLITTHPHPNLAPAGKEQDKEVKFEVAVVYSGIEQALSGTGYNKRVAECGEAARLLMEMADKRLPRQKPARNDKMIKLRDVPEEVFHAHKDNLPENLKKRATHFFTEMERVQKGAALWKKGDLEGFGKLMTESGKSSIENYECGTPALIRIYELLNSIDGVNGARFSGAGFRGSCIGLIKPSEDVRNAVRKKIGEYYKKEFPQYADNCKIAFCATNTEVGGI